MKNFDMFDDSLIHEIEEEMLEESKEKEAIYNKYYNMLTEEEKFDLAEEQYLDDNSGDSWYLAPKFIVESRKHKINK